jgi:predicted NUDIX family NTP pyrophosphohydrolase
VEGNFDVQTLASNTFPLEWPPKSGKMIDVPEVDRAGWFALEEAKMKINERQVSLLEQLARYISANSPGL